MAQLNPPHRDRGNLQQPTRLDQAAYPHLVDRIVQLSPYSALLTFRLVSKHCCKVADQLLDRVLFVEDPSEGGRPRKTLHVFKGVKHNYEPSDPNFCFPEEGSIFSPSLSLDDDFMIPNTTMVRIFGGAPNWFTPQGVLNDFDEIRCRGRTWMPDRWTFRTSSPFPQLNEQYLKEQYPALYTPFWTFKTVPHTTLVPDNIGRMPMHISFQSSWLHLQLAFDRSDFSVRNFYLGSLSPVVLNAEDVTITIRLDARQTFTSYDHADIARQRLDFRPMQGCISYSNAVQRLQVIWDVVDAPEFWDGVPVVPYRLFELVAHSVFRHLQPDIVWTVVGIDNFLFDDGTKCTLRTMKNIVATYSRALLRLT